MRPARRPTHAFRSSDQKSPKAGRSVIVLAMAKSFLAASALMVCVAQSMNFPSTCALVKGTCVEPIG